MYRNNARDGQDMVSARRLISKRVKKALLSEKSSKMRVRRFPKTGPSVKMSFGSRAFFELKWARKALVQGE